MKYHDITHDDMKNGDGLRVVLWVSGCSHKCKGCQNPITWNENSGLEFDEAAENEIFNQLEKPYISGITFSGGDPLFSSNREPVTELVKKIKERFPDKTVWLYTGYSWDDIKELEIIGLIDVLVDGKFEIDLLDNDLMWRGSSNQRVIDVKQSLLKNEVVLHCK